MQQKIVASLASFERLGGEIEQEPFLRRMEQMAAWTKPSYTKLGNLRGLAWTGFKLCNSFLHRWFNLCEVGAEEVFFAMLTPRFFACVDLDSMTAPQETATLHSRHLEQNQSQCALVESLRCGFYFHPGDLDLSLGTPLRKKPLEGVASGYSNSGFAVMGDQDFLSPADSPALTSNQSKFEIPWSTPWLYLGILLLVWLLLF